jgi:hypothetical protein
LAQIPPAAAGRRPRLAGWNGERRGLSGQSEDAAGEVAVFQVLDGAVEVGERVGAGDQLVEQQAAAAVQVDVILISRCGCDEPYRSPGSTCRRQAQLGPTS